MNCRRFKRELLLARQVTHNNVVRIFDLGDIDGIKYITMSYVEGGDLASILKRDGRLPFPAVIMLVGREQRKRGTATALDELRARMAQSPPPVKSIDRHASGGVHGWRATTPPPHSGRLSHD